MSGNKDDKLWELDEQTIGKHEILKRYLGGWIPKLGSWNGRILLVDGFAGPGEYLGGEPGSPQIMLKSVTDHQYKDVFSGAEVRCLFYEKVAGRAEHLRGVVSSIEVPDGLNLHIEVEQENFAHRFKEELDKLSARNQSLAPAFVMIDPFGVKDSPIELIERLLAFRKCECFISFMYEPIRRWHKQREFEPHLDSLFGSREWQKCKDIERSSDKKEFLHKLFRRRLKEVGAKHVISVELWKGKKHVYTLYFATNHSSGCSLMKETIWKVVPDGSFQFKGRNNRQESLFGHLNFDYTELGKELRERFASKEFTPIETIDEFMESDETMFHKGQLRRDTLRKMEKGGQIDVRRPNGGTGFKVGAGIQVRFL